MCKLVLCRDCSIWGVCKYLYESSGDSLMDDIHYANLLLEFEKLSGRLDRIEEKLAALMDGLELTQGVPEVQPEDFSRFIDFGNFSKEVK